MTELKTPYDYICYDSPLGKISLAARGDKLIALALQGQRFFEDHPPGEAREEKTPALAAAERWLDAYFAGENPDVKEIKLAPEGSAFRQKVWRELLKIPYGQTETYGTIAARVGSAPRAVGGAVGHNPISIIIPCHRVLAADGLGGYGGGLDYKIKLLRLEGGNI